MIAVKNIIPVKDAATACGVTPSRVRQICGEHDIGEKVAPNCRLLTPPDIRKLKSILAKMRRGRPRKNSPVTA